MQCNMQKAIIVQDAGLKEHWSYLKATAVNKAFAEGWKFVSASPFGVATALSGESNNSYFVVAILVIVEKEGATSNEDD
jgi:hypothetical protein